MGKFRFSNRLFTGYSSHPAVQRVEIDELMSPEDCSFDCKAGGIPVHGETVKEIQINQDKKENKFFKIGNFVEKDTKILDCWPVD